MNKISKQKLLLITAFLIILIISSIYASLVPVARAAEPSVKDKTVSILNEVVGIDTTSYATILNSQVDSKYLNMPQKEADIILKSGQGRLRVSTSFVNDRLRQIYLSDYGGELSMEKPAIATVEMAKGFLQRYRNYAGESFYGDLETMLNDIDATRNPN